MSRREINKVTFVAVDRIAKRAFNSFLASYYDEDGNQHKLVQAIDRDGNEVLYRFKFTRDKRFISIPAEKKDINGNKYVDFLRNHPYNVNSPLSSNKPWFKELDSNKDAEVALDSYLLRNKSENLALSMKEVDLHEMYKVLGLTGEEKVKFHKLMQYASKYPSDFIEKVEDPNRKATSLFKASVAKKVITKRGFRYVYNEEHLGNDDEDAIKKIASDKDLQKILEKELKKIGEW